MSQSKLGRCLAAVGRCLGMIGGLGLVIAVLVAPRFMEDSRDTGVAGSRDPGERKIVGVELLDFWASDGFADLARTVAAEVESPTREKVVAIMEARGCTNLRYIVSVRWLFEDGGVDDLSYVRKPYEEPWHDREFLLLLRGGAGIAKFFSEGTPQMIKFGPNDKLLLSEAVVEEFFKAVQKLPRGER